MRQDDFDLIWKALVEPTRRQVLDLLRERPYTTGELAQTLGVSRYAMMKHLATLEHSGLITVHKQGRERWNHLNPLPLQLVYERWLRPYEAQWANKLFQLKAVVERGQPMVEKGESGTVRSIHIELEVLISADPGQVFSALTDFIAAWWGAPYLSGRAEAQTIVLEPKVGGRLYESWGEEEGLLWATVTALKRPKELRLTGSVMMPEPTYGSVLFQLEPTQGATRLRLTHEAFGKVGEAQRAMYTHGWTDLLDTRLRAFVERGIRHGVDQGAKGWQLPENE